MVAKCLGAYRRNPNRQELCQEDAVEDSQEGRTEEQAVLTGTYRDHHYRPKLFIRLKTLSPYVIKHCIHSSRL